jgi:hypothetical protein
MFGCVLWWNVFELRQKNMQKESEKQRMRGEEGMGTLRDGDWLWRNSRL